MKSIANILIICVLFLFSAVLGFRFFSHENSELILPNSKDQTILPTIFEATPLPVVQLPPLPKSKVLTGGFHAFQTFNNCGPASLSMALSYYGINETQQTLGQSLRPYQNTLGDNDDKSVTLFELAAKAKEYGFVVYHRPAGSMEIVQQFIAHDIPVITRTWLKPGEDIGHYRVIKGYDLTTSEIIQDDSLQGKDLRYSYASFNELWEAFNYEFLVLVPQEKKEIAETILGELSNEKTAWQKAVSIAEEQLIVNQNNIYAEFNKSVALYYLGEYQGAITSFEKVEQRLPSRMLWYQIEPLLSYYHQGQYERVMAMSNKILENHNRAFSELYYIQGLIWEKQSDSVKAQQAFDTAVRYNNSSGEYWKSNVAMF